MKIAILSRETKSYSTLRIKEACLKRGHKVKILDTLKFSIYIEKGNPKLYYRGKEIERYDGIIPRIGASITFFGTAVVRQFEEMGVFSLNSSQAILISRNKLRAIQALSRHNIGLPVTSFVHDKGSILSAIESVGGAPVVIKLLEGTQGVGVILADSLSVAEGVIETLQSAKQNVLIQKFVKESKGRDIRIIVIGGKVVAAMRRVAKEGEFRSNVHRGGSVEPVVLDPVYAKVAIRAAQVLGLAVAGVDVLEGNDGPKLLEVNSSPGLEGIERATKLDLASLMVEFLEQRVQFPELDIRQRLTLTSGYGVAEVPVGEASPLVHKKIRETKLRDSDVLVVSMTRENETIPNPKGEREILPGDMLLCFGKLETLKGLIPVKISSGRKKKKKKEDLSS